MEKMSKNPNMRCYEMNTDTNQIRETRGERERECQKQYVNGEGTESSIKENRLSDSSSADALICVRFCFECIEMVCNVYAMVLLKERGKVRFLI